MKGFGQFVGAIIAATTIAGCGYALLAHWSTLTYEDRRSISMIISIALGFVVLSVRKRGRTDGERTMLTCLALLLLGPLVLLIIGTIMLILGLA